MVPQKVYEGLKDLHKTFWTTTKCEMKNLSQYFILIQLSELHGAGSLCSI